MNRNFINNHWYAYSYDQFETQTNDVEFILQILEKHTDRTPQNILEVACGGGRIAIPLAQAGNNVTGFDKDDAMLLRCYSKMKDIKSTTTPSINLSCYHANAINSDWGTGYDVVIMAGNLLINIETDMVYEEAQQLFIKKAALALPSGGHLILDYDQHSDSSAMKFFNHLGESGSLGNDTEYVDELGTKGRFKIYGNVYDPITRICTWSGHRELETNNGEKIIVPHVGHKHIPTLKQVYGWLAAAGFTLEKTYRNYIDEPLSETESDHVRATIWAKKG